MRSLLGELRAGLRGVGIEAVAVGLAIVFSFAIAALVLALV